MSIGPVERFSRIQSLRCEARSHAIVMNGDGSAPDRDLATRLYVDAVDLMLAGLNDMADDGQLDEIAEFLEITYGGGN